ncbi:MAG: hypothetical protein KDK30_00260 [Leptospiraceae bacterium]|nr:hypothetical protein [Leptospiraceae bacterium]
MNPVRRTAILLVLLKPEIAERVLPLYTPEFTQRIVAALEARPTISDTEKTEVLRRTRETLRTINRRPPDATGQPPDSISTADAHDEVNTTADANTYFSPQDHQALIDHLNTNRENVVALINAWCGDSSAKTNYALRVVQTHHWDLLRAGLRLRRSLFANSPFDRLRFTVWSDSLPVYSWVVRDNGVVLRLPDEHRVLADERSALPEDAPVPSESRQPSSNLFAQGSVQDAVRTFEHRDLPDEIPILIQQLQDLYVPLRRERIAQRLGATVQLLFELPPIRKFVLLDAHDLPEYEPFEYCALLQDLVRRVEEHCFPFLGAYRRALRSPVARMPAEFLHHRLRNELDATVAYLDAHLPLRNLQDCIRLFPEDRRGVIQTRSRALRAGGDLRPEVLREIERNLERQFFAANERTNANTE